MPAPQDLTGKIFGKLSVIDWAGKEPESGWLWLCKCACGNEKILSSAQLKRSKSCGCMRAGGKKHGKTGTPEHSVWCGMMARCGHWGAKGGKYYAGRGISVCSRWHSFENFFNDMGERPSKNHTIERIDNDSGYSPDNCKWATRKEQANNRRPKNSH